MPMETPELSDGELARQTQAGSLPAFDELVRRHQDRVFRFVRQSCRADADAAEITQETFIRAFRVVNRYDPTRPFHAWLLGIARHKTLDYHRAYPAAIEAAAVEAGTADDPGEELARVEEHHALWRLARLHLSETQFQALWLRYVEDLDLADTARVLGKTVTHTKVILFRARQILASRWDRAQGAGKHAIPTAPPCPTPPTPPSLKAPPHAKLA